MLSNTIEVNNLFFEQTSEFTIFMVENRFFTETGREFFLKHKKHSKGYLDNEYRVKNFLEKDIYSHIFKFIEKPSSFIKQLFEGEIKLSLAEVINLLSKTFGVIQQHAAGPEFIDPIIIFEGATTTKTIGLIIELYKGSHLKPKIIVVSKDNNYLRIKDILCYCPHRTKIIYLENNLRKTESYVHNAGADNIDEFVSLYAKQCYNACSRTETDLLYNPEWAADSTIKEFSPQILQVRTKLMVGEKLSAISTVDDVISRISTEIKSAKSERDRNLILSFDGFSKLFRVFCNDYGGTDINDVLKIAEHLDNDLLRAHVYRYAEFMSNVDSAAIDQSLLQAEDIFRENEMEDHSLYCINNRLMRTFDTDEVSPEKFKHMTRSAMSNVPGLVGMPILMNNTGVAYLLDSKFEQAISYFKQALDYQPQNDHKLGISCNLALSEYLDSGIVDESTVCKLFFEAQNNFDLEKQSCLVANNLTNLAYIVSKNKNISADLFNTEFYKKVLYKAYQGPFGVNSLTHQVSMINHDLNINLPISKNVNIGNSKRSKFIGLSNLNPAIYCAWL